MPGDDRPGPDAPVDADATDSRAATDADWPAALRGVTESIVATRGPNDRWNHAALGLFAPDHTPGSAAAEASTSVTARTWGRTRTWRNFRERGEGRVQFTTDPREFVAAAVTVHETDKPTLPGAAAWTDVRVESLESGVARGTEWTDWALDPVESSVEESSVPTINRGFNAVVESTVAASRLEVPGYDDAALLERLNVLASVVERAGGKAEREAMALLDRETGWRERVEE